MLTCLSVMLANSLTAPLNKTNCAYGCAHLEQACGSNVCWAVCMGAHHFSCLPLTCGPETEMHTVCAVTRLPSSLHVLVHACTVPCGQKTQVYAHWFELHLWEMSWVKCDVAEQKWTIINWSVYKNRTCLEKCFCCLHFIQSPLQLTSYYGSMIKILCAQYSHFT